MLAALTRPERAAWMWRHGRVLDPYLVVCQLRDGAQILRSGVCLIGMSWCCALVSASACSCSRPVATGTLSLRVVWPGQVNEIPCGAPSNASMLCGDVAQGALA